LLAPPAWQDAGATCVAKSLEPEVKQQVKQARSEATSKAKPEVKQQVKQAQS
jgi:hypothetical protein